MKEVLRITRTAVAPRLAWTAALAVVANGCLSDPAQHATSTGGAATASASTMTSTSTSTTDASSTSAGALPGFGEICTAALECGPGLICSATSDAFTITRTFAAPICVVECDPAENLCGPGSQGLCSKATGSPPRGLCVRYCDAAGTNACPDGQLCEMSFGTNIGICRPRCIEHGCERNEAGFGACHADGSCQQGAAEPVPEEACVAAATCVCFPKAGSGGTCRIACQSDADCPVQPDTGTKMVCPCCEGATIPAFGFCAVPCEGPGAADCAELALGCSTTKTVDGLHVCE